MIPRLDLEPAAVAGNTVDPEVVHLLPEGLVRQHMAIPVCIDDGELVVAFGAPPDLALLDQIELVTGFRVRPIETPEREIRRMIERFFTVDNSFSDGLGDMGGEGGSSRSGGIISLNERLGSRHDAPAVRLVDSILRGAARRGASDIHVEPLRGELLVRYRQDGVLHDMMKVSSNLQEEVVSRIKLLSHLDITEHRMPQDGRISVRMEAAEFDMRVSTLPTSNGEKVAIRLLNKSSGALSLSQIGMTEQQLALFARAIARPYGMLILAGPTGSGKTTTLYAALREVDRKRLNVTTIEDPVEYSFDRVNQIQVNTTIGLTFAAALRTVLRQDPDIIMVGEIRDTETARLAVQAAMTGHLLFSTVHANDAPSVMNRLKDLEVAPFLIASTLATAISQRLVRRICPECTEPYDPPRELVVGTPLEGATLTHGRGCDMCLNTGYRGRMGIYEILPMSGAIREAFLQGASNDALRAIGCEGGLIPMREAAIEAARKGLTTVDEIRRILPVEELQA
ncbi:MAG: type II/IV secretion system protein [Planctomycetes bacterium]|nr:type II/IV secretion system protein [Planctomycetota bacterium]